MVKDPIQGTGFSVVIFMNKNSNIRRDSMNINLHIHSNNSDGKFNCQELINIINDNNLNLVSLTDHDTMKGVPEFLHLCDINNITCIPGVEISSYVENCMSFIDVNYLTTFHILGYFPKYFNETYIAEVLNLVKSFPNPQESINFIHRLNGIAILAHPFFGIKRYYNATKEKFSHDKIKITSELVEQVIVKCKEFSIDGIEAYYEDNTDEDTLFLVDLAKKIGLKTTIGTDYHRTGNSIISKYNDIDKYNFCFDNRTYI